MPAGSVLRILVVDDDVASRSHTCDLLERARLRPAEFAAVTFADARAHAARADLVLVDDGAAPGAALALARELAEQDRLVLLLSADDDPEVESAAAAAGLADLLLKDHVDERSLGRAIRYALWRRHDRSTLTELAARQEALARNLPDTGVVTCDPDLKILTCDGGVYRAYLQDPAKMVGRNLADVLTHLGMAHQIELYRRAAAGESFDLEQAHGDRTYTVRFGPLRAAATGGAISVALDITGQRQAERELAIERERFRLAFESSAAGFAIASPKAELLEVNRSYAAMLGYEPHELIGLRVPDITHPDDLASTANFFAEALSGGAQTGQFEKDFSHRDGHAVPALVSASLLRDADGEPVLVTAQVQDLSARKAVEEALRNSERRFSSAFHEAPIGMAIIGLDGAVEQVNESLCTMLGHTPESLTQLRFHAFVHPDERGDAEGVLRRLLQGEAKVDRAERRYIHADGRTIWADRSVTVIRDDAGRPHKLVAQIMDVTERRRFEERLRHLAEHDALTGLANRRKFEQTLDHHVLQCVRYGAHGALLMLDIDDFKTVNDTYGHSTGDQVIVRVAQVLRQELRESDVLARLGGDEFAILLPQGGRDEANVVAGKLVDAVSGQVVPDADRRVTISVGVQPFDECDPLTAQRAVIDADLAMYTAKRHGRNSWSTVPSGPLKLA